MQSSGTDNALFRIGNDYIVRLPRIDWATKSVHKEFEWVPKIARFLETPISEPIFLGNSDKSYPWPWTVNNWNEGNNPQFEQKDEYAELASDLAIFLNQMHGIRLPNGPSSRRGVPLRQLDSETRKSIGQLRGEIDIESLTSLWDQLSSIPAWNKDPVWVHGDFLSGNILVEHDRLRAVIDFSDVGVGDPACDLVSGWSLLNSPSRKIFRSSLEGIDDDTWERGRGWALSISLIMLPYHKHSNPVLASLARRMIKNVLMR